MMMKKILMFFLIFLLAFANTDEWIVIEKSSFVYAEDKNTLKKSFWERVAEKESAVVMARGKVQANALTVRKNRIRIYFYFLFMCFLYFQFKKNDKREIFIELGNFLDYHILRMRQIHQMDGKKRGEFLTFINA
ncbi:hypothetical protein [Faecalimonas sp.]